ncbi:hypothetical protein [Aquincola tertiaricarbonis]|uniref:hypothetical protein n=1 Tax=Aquincola tertiaricarbonis TaxID=391953 RepID=UPI000614BF5E|nr:hypothetical protein [Aquincola tertiaricarbonis]
MFKLLASSIVLTCCAAGANAFSCAPTETEDCRLELSTVTVRWDKGIDNFIVDTQFNGSDGYVNGYGSSADFPNLTAVDTAGGTRAGFSFLPNMVGQVGGSGINGYHEGSASFLFERMEFIAKSGFKVDAIEFTITGSRSQVGNGYAAIGVPGVPEFTGDSFVATALWTPNQTTFGGSISVSASYQEGEDGTAADYGTAFASLDSVRIVAHVSAIPEPAQAYMLLSGGLVLLAAGRLRSRR